MFYLLKSPTNNTWRNIFIFVFCSPRMTGRAIFFALCVCLLPASAFAQVSVLENATSHLIREAATAHRTSTLTDTLYLEASILTDDLVSAAHAPIINDNNQVSWTFSPVDSDLTLTIEPFVEMPLASNGLPARWNTMTILNDQLFIADERDGRIYNITGGSPVLWFDVSNAIQSTTGRQLNTDSFFHGGLRSIAFHPDFASNGKLYTSLMEDRPSNSDLHHYLSDEAALDADSVLVEWTVNIETMMVDPSSYREVFRVGIPEYDHPIKQILFDTSTEAGDSNYGLLYIAHGDGSRESTTTLGGQGNDALGKILRINPFANGSSNYTIPDSNPFVGDSTMLDEVWSLGHRNPHHLAFTQNGSLLVSDVGRDNIDEINLVMPGADYGWLQREGAYQLLNQPGLADGIAVLPEKDEDNLFVYPVAQFGHTGSVGESFTGQGIGGGFAVENGSELNGLYFYVDFPRSGEIFHSRITDLLAANIQGPPETLTVARTWRDSTEFDHDNNPNTAPIESSLKSIVQTANGFVNINDRVDVRIGQGPSGELYIYSKRNNMVYRISNSMQSEPVAQPSAEFEFSSSGSADNGRWQVFNFNVEAGQRVDVRVNWNDLAADVRMFLRDETRTQVARDTDGVGVGRVSTTADSSGQWSVAVLVRSDNTTDYDVIIETFSTTPPISVPDFAFSSSGSRNDKRWQVFKFNIEAGETVDARVDWNDPAADVRVFLRDQTRTQVDRDTDDNGSGMVSGTADSNGQWSIAVLVNSPDTVNYDIIGSTEFR